MEYHFDKSLYPKAALIKAAFSFTDRAYLHLDQTNKNWVVLIKQKESCAIKYEEFENEMLAQSARCLINQQTKNVRQLILGRALASTLVVQNSSTEENQEDMDISGALKSWFAEHE